ncbi:MAG: hypothetical protein PVH62_02980 [Anaerolineae bacterium]|jgi:hypothetical protein
MGRWLPPTLALLALLTLLAFGSTPTTAGPAQITPLPPVVNTDGRAGACYSFYDPPERPFVQMALDAGSRWDRFDFSWPAIEPKDNEWNFRPHEDLVDDLHAGGIENIVAILLWTPDWASTSGATGLSAAHFDQRPPGWYAPVPRSDVNSQSVVASAASSPPRGLYLAWDDPGNLWGDYVYNVVTHFAERGVTHWEMWNEPEWGFWSGTSADYAQLLKVGYQATKAACPDCTVLFGGLHYWANPSYYRWVLRTISSDPLAPQNNYFFDVMSVHLYSRSSNTYDVINEIRSGMTTFATDHPIWLTETGVPVWDDASVAPGSEEYDYAATQQEAAAYVIQSYANAWASGVERYFFFRTHDADLGEYFGLIRNDSSLRPAYVAYQVATTYLVSPTMATSWTYSNGARRATLWGTPRGKVSVLWNTISTTLPFDYPAILPTATLVDRWGVTQTITATEGSYTLTLPGATANLVTDATDYFIGGEPYLVIEADTAPPTVTVGPLPSTTYSHTIPVSWDGSDGETDVWGVDLQVREGTGGIWTDWLGLAETEGITSAVYAADQHDETYCFRARAWDRAGNRSEWSTDTDACTTLNFRREVHFQLGSVFGDGNYNEVLDSGEITLTEVSLRFVDEDGLDVVPPAIGSSWEFTATLLAGDYTLILFPGDWPTPPPGWLPKWEPVVVEPGESVQEIGRPAVGLLPHRASSYLPLTLRGP